MLQGCFMLWHSLLHPRVAEIRVSPRSPGDPTHGERLPLIFHFLHVEQMMYLPRHLREGKRHGDPTMDKYKRA